MNEGSGYAVFLFPQALQALGDAVRPFLQDGPAGPFVACNEIDTGGSMVEMTLHGSNPSGQRVTCEVMVPSSMVRMIVSRQNDGLFGFGPHAFEKPLSTLPAVGPTGEAAGAPPQSPPGAGAPVDTDQAAVAGATPGAPPAPGADAPDAGAGKPA